MSEGPAPLRIASFGFRSFPPREGSAGAEKYALELLPRLVQLGHTVVAYPRAYGQELSGAKAAHEYLGVEVRPLRTFKQSGLEALWHSAKVTLDILISNRADVIHMQNGGNSPFALLLRLFGKRTFLSEDGNEWQRGKWSRFGRSYLRMTTFISAYIHNQIIFDNIFTQRHFESKFKRNYAFVPFGADVAYDSASEGVLTQLNLKKGDYFLFVGRFIPDKGLHHLLPAFERLETTKRLVLIGGSPHPSEYERAILRTRDPRVVLPGYIYGGAVHALMRHCYAYVQPSDLEGLSPVILESAYLGAPVICSDLEENRYGLQETGIYFQKGNVDDLSSVLAKAIAEPAWLTQKAGEQSERVRETFSWDQAVDEHVRIFREF